MAYLGNKPVNNFVSFAKQNITGNGGTSYSLDYPVTGANDIELFINNVRQEPTEAYSCSGSTLTLTGAVSSTDDVYVIFRGRALQTAQHPSDSALEAASAIIDTNTFVVDAVNNRVGIGTSAPAHLADIQGAGVNQTLMRFRSSGTSSASKLEFLGTNTGGSGSQVAHITVSQPSGGSNTDAKMDFLVRKSGDAFDSPGVGLSIDRGMVTMPRQPAFHAKAHDTYTVSGNANTVTFDNIFLNRGSMYSTSTNRMTAPIAGTYWIYFEGLINSSERDTVDIRFYKNGAQTQTASIYQVDYGSSYRKVNMTSIIDLSANDYIDVRPQASGVYTFYGDSGAFISNSGGGHTAFKGYLIG